MNEKNRDKRQPSERMKALRDDVGGTDADDESAFVRDLLIRRIDRGYHLEDAFGNEITRTNIDEVLSAPAKLAPKLQTQRRLKNHFARLRDPIPTRRSDAALELGYWDATNEIVSELRRATADRDILVRSHALASLLNLGVDDVQELAIETLWEIANTPDKYSLSATPALCLAVVDAANAAAGHRIEVGRVLLALSRVAAQARSPYAESFLEFHERLVDT